MSSRLSVATISSNHSHYSITLMYLNILIHCLAEFSYIPLVSRQTRTTISSYSLIYNIFKNYLQLANLSKTHIMDLGISDHALIIHSLPLTSSSPPSNSKPSPYYQINSTTLNNLSLGLHDVSWSDVIDSDNANTALISFTTVS